MRAMAEARIEHIFNCSEDTFWNKVFFDADYNKRLFREELAFPRWEEVSKEDKGDQIRRVIEIVPKMADLPGPLKKLAGDGVSYREEGIFDKKTRRYKVTIHPNRLSDKLFIKGFSPSLPVTTSASGSTSLQSRQRSSASAECWKSA